MLAKRYTQIVTAFVFLAGVPAWAADSAALIAEMEGVYKHRFKNSYVPTGDGRVETYISEDVVEIVRYDDSSIYVRADLFFYNGHICGVSGIARFDAARKAFVYRPRDEEYFPGEPDCALAVSIDGKDLVLNDGGTCQRFCGQRGRLAYSIARSSKRKIRYMERLLASSEYQAAVEEAKK